MGGPACAGTRCRDRHGHQGLKQNDGRGVDTGVQSALTGGFLTGSLMQRGQTLASWCGLGGAGRA